MRDLRLVEIYRDAVSGIRLWGWPGDQNAGFFKVPSPSDNTKLTVLATTEADWDHVSVSRGDRCPNWDEMEHVKRLFFKAEETAMQLHVPPADHVNYHPFCLHLWRPQGQDIPRPPAWMVGPGGRE